MNSGTKESSQFTNTRVCVRFHFCHHFSNVTSLYRVGLNNIFDILVFPIMNAFLELVVMYYIYEELAKCLVLIRQFPYIIFSFIAGFLTYHSALVIFRKTLITAPNFN